MIINTQKIRKYAKIIQFVREKGHDQHSNLYLDFDAKEILFQNSSLIFGKIDLEFTGEKEENLYVPADKFLHLASLYEEIEFRDGVFYGNESSYELLYFDGKGSYPDIEIPEKTIEITEELYENFVNAFSYIDDDPYSALHGLFLKDSRIIATNRVKLYDYRLSTECQGITLPYSIIKLITVTGRNKRIRIADKKTSPVTILVDDDLILYQATDSILELIDTMDPKFINSYYHKEFLTIDRVEFLNEIATLTPFLETLPNNRISLKFETPGELKLIVNSSNDTVDFAKVEKVFTGVKYSDFQYFRDKYLLLSSLDLKKALQDFNQEYITIQVSFDSKLPAINLSQDGRFHIILTKLQD